MKKILICFFVCSCYLANAYDFTNYYLSIDPGFKKNTIGIRNNWRFAEWTPILSNLRMAHTTHNGVEHETAGSLEESFMNTELFVKYGLGEKVRLYIILPFSVNTLKYQDQTETRQSFSDLTLMANYKICSSKPGDSVGVSHQLYAGAGIKFPTGKSEGASEVDLPQSQHLYSGTGSTDYIFSITYAGMCKKLGWNLDASYKLNGESENYYRYGNTLNINPRAFYQVSIKSLKLLPHLGAGFESCSEDEHKDVKRVETDGQVIWGNAGVDFYLGMFSLTTEFAMPLGHDYGAQISEDQSLINVSININF